MGIIRTELPVVISTEGAGEIKGLWGDSLSKEQNLKDLWRVAVKKAVPGNKTKLWQPSKHDIVCHKHFKPDGYTIYSGQRKRLKKGVIPSVFPERMTEADEIKGEERKRRKERAERRTQSSTVTSTSQHTYVVNLCNIQNEVEISYEDEPMDTNEDSIVHSGIEESIQCELLTDRSGQYTIENYKNDPEPVKYYTGFDDYDQFMMFYHVLGPTVDHLLYKCQNLEPKDQLFLTLMKLRQNKEDYELGLFFKISQPTASKIIETWINFIYCQLKEINFWPDREIVSEYMPEDFKRKYSSTRVILDATENPIQKPSHVTAQSITFSTYKHKNTLKTMIGISPRGLVTYVSDSYGGSASDRQIVERSVLCKKNLFDKKDSIMADRGIMVQDLFATKDITINTPTMLAGKSQLEPEVVVRDRRVSSIRIHVERVIGLAKSFKILRSDLPKTKLNLGSRITFVCFNTANFRRCIVGKLA